MRKKKRPLCGSFNTHTGQPCRLYADSCPYEAHKYPSKSRSAAATPSAADLDLTADSLTISGNDLSIPDWLGGYISDTEHGIHTNVEDFIEVITKAREVYPLDILRQDIIRDTYMMSSLWSLSQRYPNGIIDVKNPIPRKGGGEYIPTGRFIFVGGTALSAAHGTTQRYSQDLDFLYVPNLKGIGKHNIIKRRHDIIKTAAEGVSSLKPRYLRSTGIVVKGLISLPETEDFVNLDIVNRKEFYENPGFRDRLELLEVQQKPIMSMLGRAAPSFVEKYPQLGGFSLPVVGEPYIATTKYDALTRRALDPNLHYQITDRWRDLYDLHCLAISDNASHIRKQIPEVCYFPENDTLRPENHKRPDGGYGH